MRWNVAQAKQRLSELLRRTREEPQLIYNRDRLSAAVIDADEYVRYTECRETSERPSLAAGAASVREVMAAERYELPTTPRETRENPLVATLDEEPG